MLLVILFYWLRRNTCTLGNVKNDFFAKALHSKLLSQSRGNGASSAAPFSRNSDKINHGVPVEVAGVVLPLPHSLLFRPSVFPTGLIYLSSGEAAWLSVLKSISSAKRHYVGQTLVPWDDLLC